MKQPNILFLMSDEHRFDVAGFAGNQIVRTPNLDRLAKDAVVFENAYTPCPVCIPARQCMAVGQYPKTCGVQDFFQDLPPNSRTFARQFTENGYCTVASGKLHHRGIDQMQGWMIRVAGDCAVDRKFYEAQSNSAAAKPASTAISNKWSDSKEIRRAGPGDSAYARADRLSVQGLKDYIYQHFVDSFYDRPTPEQSVMLYLGLLNPHYPYVAEQSKFDYYLNRVQPYANNTPFDHPFLGVCPNDDPILNDQTVSDREIKRAMAAYYANIETIDDQFGQIIAELEQAGQNIDDWIVIYTSDHGEMLGEHAIWEKQKFFEGSAKVPLFIRWPKHFAARSVKENVNLIDLYATLCTLCEVPVPQSVESRSLVALMQGNAENWNNETISQCRGNVMVKRNDLKYHCYADKSEVLFDLQNDPGETKNCIDLPQYQAVLQSLRAVCKNT